MPGLGTTYGRGGATSSPKDLLNSDAILIMGSNMAENHPVGFQWVMEAKERGADLQDVRAAAGDQAVDVTRMGAGQPGADVGRWG